MLKFFRLINVNYKVNEASEHGNRSLGFTLDSLSVLFAIISLMVMIAWDQ